MTSMGRFALRAALATATLLAPSAAATVPQAGTIVGTFRLSPRDTPFDAATAGRLFAVVVPPGGHRMTVLRITRDGCVTKRRLAFGLASDVANVSAGPDGLYAGTAVIHRFQHVPDQLVRIDVRTLRVVARASFGSSVAAVEQGRSLWASLGDGHVVRLDPRTLAIRASRRIASPLSAPAIGAGSLWVLAGDRPHLELVRIDPVRLTVRSRTRIGERMLRRAAIYAVAAGEGRVYLTGDAIVLVDAAGRLASRLARVPGLAIADVEGSTLVGLVSAPPALIRLDSAGRVVARTALHDAGSRLAVSGRDAWFVGDGGRGYGIVHVRLGSR